MFRSGKIGAAPKLSAALTPSVAPQWFAAYTSAHHEKAVAERLAQRTIESFLPLYRTMRLWKNGCKVTLELPLFPGYIFVRIPTKERVRVLEIPGVLSLVGAMGNPVPLPEADIEALRAAIHGINCEPHPYLVVGERARIKSGPLACLEGILLRKKNLLRVVLSLDLITQSMAVEVDADNVEPIVTGAKRYALS
jgi:transcription antitermination factor NusG